MYCKAPFSQSRFAPVITSRYTVINRGTVPTKNDRVLTVTVLPRVAPVLFPVLPRYRHGAARFAPVASRLNPVASWFIHVCPGIAPVHPGGVPVTAGRATVSPGIENDSNRGEPGRHRGEPWRHRDKLGRTVVKSLKPVCPGGVPVHTGEFRFVPRNSPVPSPWRYGLPRCRPGLTRFLTLVPLRSGTPRFY